MNEYDAAENGGYYCEELMMNEDATDEGYIVDVVVMVVADLDVASVAVVAVFELLDSHSKNYSSTFWSGFAFCEQC